MVFTNFHKQKVDKQFYCCSWKWNYNLKQLLVVWILDFLCCFCSLFVLANANMPHDNDDDAWIEPYDMLNYDTAHAPRRRTAQVETPQFEAEDTREKASDVRACELSCSSLQLDVCPSPELDEVVSFHCSSSLLSVPSHSSPSAEEDLPPHSSSISPVSLSSSLQVTVNPDLQIEDVEDEELEDEEDMEISGKSCDPQVVPLQDLEITDMEEMDSEEEMVKTEKSVQTTNTLLLTRPGPLEPRRVAWVEDSEEEEEEEVWETEVMEIKACEEEETGDSVISQKKEEHQPQSRRQVSLVMFTWAEKRAKERVEKKMKKETEKRERRMLHHRYVNDPKLQHLKINRNNPNYGS